MSGQCIQQNCSNYGNPQKDGYCNACARGETPDCEKRRKEAEREQQRRQQQEESRIAEEESRKARLEARRKYEEEHPEEVELERTKAEAAAKRLEEERALLETEERARLALRMAEQERIAKEESIKTQKEMKSLTENLQIGETIHYLRDLADSSSQYGTNLSFTRLSSDEYQRTLASKTLDPADLNPNVFPSQSYGLTCPRCDSKLILIRKSITNDSFLGIERDTYLCSELSCAIRREYEWQGY